MVRIGVPFLSFEPYSHIPAIEALFNSRGVRRALPEEIAPDTAANKVERYRTRLVAAEADLLDVRGILSPNGYEPRTPLPLTPTVAPAVAWLVGENERLREALAERSPVNP